MIELSPRNQFRQNADDLRIFSRIANGDVTQRAITAAFAEYCMINNPSSEETQGIQLFIHTFLNLAETEKAEPAFPDKRLNYDAGLPPKPPTA
jgi:hypothetical protein